MWHAASGVRHAEQSIENQFVNTFAMSRVRPADASPKAAMSEALKPCSCCAGVAAAVQAEALLVISSVCVRVRVCVRVGSGSARVAACQRA